MAKIDEFAQMLSFVVAAMWFVALIVSPFRVVSVTLFEVSIVIAAGGFAAWALARTAWWLALAAGRGLRRTQFGFLLARGWHGRPLRDGQHGTLAHAIWRTGALARRAAR